MKQFVFLLVVAVALVGCKGPMAHNAPPAEMLMSPGPGVGGPGPGVMMCEPGMPAMAECSQVAFVGPAGMAINWDVSAAGAFDSEPLICPAPYNFPQGAIYRMKLTNIPGREGVELYPTLEVAPTLPRTSAFLSHNTVPVQFTEEDFDQVLSGNFVTKVIYLPDPEFQGLAEAGVETLVSTRLDPGEDPIVEADRRGAILGIVRLGNKDLEIPGQAVDIGGVQPVSYNAPCDCGPTGAPMGMAMPSAMGGAYVGGATPSNYISGVTGPQYGLPSCGTPIGLAGPPHIPLGVPAGLQKHVIKNHTRVHIPKPVAKMKVDVKQRPGISYPQPVNHVRIVENSSAGLGLFHQPLSNKLQCIQDGGCVPSDVPCEEGVPCGTSCETGICQ